MKGKIPKSQQVYWWVFSYYDRGGAIIRAKTEKQARDIAAPHAGIGLSEVISVSSHLSIRGVVRKVFNFGRGGENVAFNGDPFRLLTSSGFTVLDEVTDRRKHFKPRR